MPCCAVLCCRWTKRLFDELLATDSDNSSSSSSVGGRKSAAATSPAAAAAVHPSAPLVGPEVAHSYTVYSNPLAVADGECDWPARTQYRGTLGGSGGSGGSVRRATTSKHQQELEALQKVSAGWSSIALRRHTMLQCAGVIECLCGCFDAQEVDAGALSSQLTRLASRITTGLGQDEFGSFGSNQPTSQQLLAEVLPLLWGMKAMLTDSRL